MNISTCISFLILLVDIFQINGDPTTILDHLKKVIETAKTAKNIWDYVKDYPPTFADYLISIGSKSNDTKDSAPTPRSSYDFVVDLTRPSDIFSGLKAYPVTFPMGKEVYDEKIKEDDAQISRFVVNVVGRYNVGKTYILRLLANIDLGHTFVERTNGLSVSLPSLSQTHDAPMALIDTAGMRTPVEYHDSTFKEKSYERQVSDSFIQEIAFSSAEIFVFVVNQLTLDDQLYLTTLYQRLKDKNFKEDDIKQRLLIVHNYFNLKTLAEIEETEKMELIKIFGARKQPQGYWLSEHFKHFVIACNGSEAGDKYNGPSMEQIRTMIKGSNAAKHNDVLSTIIQQIEVLLGRVLVEALPSKTEDERDSNRKNIFSQVYDFVAAILPSHKENRLNVSNKRHIEVKLEVKQLDMDAVRSLWFICPKQTLADNITLSKNLKFADDGSVHIDYSSQFIPDVQIFQLKNRDVQIRVECPSCDNSYNVTVRGTSVFIRGEKIIDNIEKNKDYLNTNRVGKFEIEVPVGKMEPYENYDFRKNAIDNVYVNGVIIITIPNISNEL